MVGIIHSCILIISYVIMMGIMVVPVTLLVKWRCDMRVVEEVEKVELDMKEKVN